MTARRTAAPRWRTPLPPGVAGSWGPAAIAYARHELGLELDRWQRVELNRALAVDAEGRLVHRIYLSSTARQNGKTVVVRTLVGWALTAASGPAWRTILGLAHDRKQARIPYVAVLEDLEPIRRRFPRGGLHLTRYLGIRSDLYGRHREYDTGSRESRNAIRGTSNDLLLLDEVRTQTTYDTWAAAEPTTRARLEPLIFLTSTAGDDRSYLLRDLFDRGRRIIDGAEPARGFGMTWYAAPDDADPRSRRAIAAANPGLAEGRLRLEAIESGSATLSPASYRAETLNLWTEGVDEWLPAGVWRARVAPAPAAAQRVLFGVEVVPSWRRASVIVAIVTDSGVWVGFAGELDASRTSRSSVSPADLGRLLDELGRAWRPAAIAFSGTAAAAPTVAAWAERTRTPAIALGPRHVRAASELFRSELIGARLGHADDELLAQQARTVRPSGPLERGAWYLSIAESAPSEVDAIRAAAWVAWAAIAPEARQVAPQIFV